MKERRYNGIWYFMCLAHRHIRIHEERPIFGCLACLLSLRLIHMHRNAHTDIRSRDKI